MGAKVECIQQANAILGEGPLWDWRTGDLYWIDIRRRMIFRHELATGLQTGQWVAPERIGCIALTQDTGALIVAAGLTVCRLSLNSGDLHPIADLGAGRPRHRFNDGAVDAMGRLWVGTMLDDYHAPEAFVGGALHRIDPDGGVTTFGTYLLPNGIGWSADNQTMYLNDTAAGTTLALDFDLTAGRVGADRVIFRAGPDDGGPDGLTVDAAGNIWCAMWDGGCVLKLAPFGTVLGRLDMPVRRPSSVTFGGDDLDQLLITSATVGFASADYRQSPVAGGLFRQSTNATGKRENLFGPAAPGMPQ